MELSADLKNKILKTESGQGIIEELERGSLDTRMFMPLFLLVPLDEDSQGEDHREHRKKQVEKLLWKCGEIAHNGQNNLDAPLAYNEVGVSGVCIQRGYRNAIVQVLEEAFKEHLIDGVMSTTIDLNRKSGRKDRAM